MPQSTIASLRAAADLGAYVRRSVLLRLALFLALALPLVWLGASFERRELERIAQGESQRGLRNLAQAFSEEVNATIGTIDMSLLHLRSHWEQDPAQFPQMVERLNRELHGRVILAIALTDARGRLVYASGKAPKGMDLSDRDYVRYHLEGHEDSLFVSRPLVGRVSGQWRVQFSRPVLDAKGRLTGVITASVSPSYFKRFYMDIDLGPGTSIALVRRDGTVITRTSRLPYGDVMGKVLEGPPYQGQRPDGARDGLFRRASRADGVDRYYAWRDLPDYPLLVTVGQAVTDANARYARQEQMLMQAATVVSVLVVLVGWVALAASDHRRRATRALTEAEARWKLALNAAGEGVWDCDLVTGVAALSPRAQEILDRDSQAVRFDAAGLQELVHAEDMPRVRYALAEHFAGRAPDYTVEHRIRRRDGQWSWILARGSVAERDNRGRPLRMVGTFANIDTRKSEEAQIRHQATHDALTGLPNRVLFADRLRQAVLAGQREKTRLAVLYFDLDKFKPVNDTHGHAVGDALLISVAQRVSGSLRESDTLARLGGDEFAVLLPRCGGPDDARKVGENILAQINRPFPVDQLVLNISCSVGFALFPDNGLDGETLLRSADQAMYDAKTHGRSQVRGAGRNLPVVLG
jgi:diguanylate cyclase (GGDEF)-like protein/PAS domain S-box-containing protein